MTGLSALVVPILLSAVIVFVASSIIHMLLPWHHSDYPKLPNEDGVRDALRPLAIPPGDYMVPRPSSTEDMRSPEFAEKMKQGPVLIFTVRPQRPSLDAQESDPLVPLLRRRRVFAAYIVGRALPPGTPYPRVFQLVGAAVSVGYVLALWQMSIWYHRWTTSIKGRDGYLRAADAGTLAGFGQNESSTVTVGRLVLVTRFRTRSSQFYRDVLACSLLLGAADGFFMCGDPFLVGSTPSQKIAERRFIFV
jgi:hypothetical protein